MQLKIMRVSNGYILGEGDAPSAVAMDPEMLGKLVTEWARKKEGTHLPPGDTLSYGAPPAKKETA